MPVEIVKPAALCFLYGITLPKDKYIYSWDSNPSLLKKKYVHSDNLNYLPPPNFSYSAFFLA